MLLYSRLTGEEDLGLGHGWVRGEPRRWAECWLMRWFQVGVRLGRCSDDGGLGGRMDGWLQNWSKGGWGFESYWGGRESE